MMRGRLLEWGILVVAIVGVVFLVIGGGMRKGRFDDLVINKDKWYDLMSRREKTSEGLIKRVSFNREDLITTDGGNEWYYSMVERREDAKNPEVSYREEGVELAVLEDKITDEKIRSGEAIKMMAYTGEKYEIYELFVTTLPVMKISHTGPLDITKADGEVGMKMELFDNRAGATQRLTLSDGRIKVRGAGTSTYPKKGFRINLRMMSVGENRRMNNVSLLGMRQDDDWLLYAGYNDQEKVRNVFATNLWKKGQARNNEFGLDNGVEYKYVELIMNDEYYGLYALGYPVDELVLKLKQEADGKYEEFSFKKVQWDEYGDSILDTYELKTDVENPVAAWADLENYDKLISSNGSVDEIRQAVDMGNAIDYSLFVELIQGSDNDYKNLYLTAKDRGNDKVWIYTPWDLDLTFGYTGNGGELSRITGVVVNRLQELKDGEIDSELAKRYRELREGAWSNEQITEMINEYEKEIYRSGAFSRDMERWPEGNYNDADEELTRFREYVLERLVTMDRIYL